MQLAQSTPIMISSVKLAPCGAPLTLPSRMKILREAPHSFVPASISNVPRMTRLNTAIYVQASLAMFEDDRLVKDWFLR